MVMSSHQALSPLHEEAPTAPKRMLCVCLMQSNLLWDLAAEAHFETAKRTLKDFLVLE